MNKADKALLAKHTDTTGAVDSSALLAEFHEANYPGTYDGATFTAESFAAWERASRAYSRRLVKLQDAAVCANVQVQYPSK